MCDRRIDFDFCELENEFRRAGRLRPALQPNGAIFKYRPYGLYNNRNNLDLMTLDGNTIGDNDFCLFVIDDGETINENDDLTTATVDLLPRRQGVYIWVCEDKVIYVGRAKDDNKNSLYKRFKNGYGKISPRNCYEGGQLTNLKMNRVVIDYYENNRRIDLYYYECQNSIEIEAELIDRNWQRKVEGRAMQFNSRHERTR